MVATTRSRKRRYSEQAFLEVLERVAENGWFPFWTKEHSSLRLVCRSVKVTVDEPSNGGPDWSAIVDLLDNRNRFDLTYCEYCEDGYWKDEQDGKACQSCTGWNHMDPSACKCQDDHRYHPLLRKMDPRQNSYVDFDSLPPREQAEWLLKFHRWCVRNFLSRYDDSDDLGLVDCRMAYCGSSEWMYELEEYNRPLYNLMHNLLFIGWAEKDLSWSRCAPGTCSPYRYAFLQGRDADEYWHGGHRETFYDITLSFLESHQPREDEKTVVEWPSRLTKSQLQHIPEIIRRCVENSRDVEAERLLGPDISSSIDLYRSARTTPIPVLEWMPCLGGDEESYVPLTSFDGYNPRKGHVDCTVLSVHPLQKI